MRYEPSKRSLYDLVKDLTGPVTAAGEEHLDRKRMVNLEEVLALVGELLADVRLAARTADDPRDSMQRIGKRARAFLADLDADSERLQQAEDLVSRVEALFPDWKAYRDLPEAVEVTLHRLRNP